MVAALKVWLEVRLLALIIGNEESVVWEAGFAGHSETDD